MNEVLSNVLVMTGLRNTKEMPIYPDWVLAENMEQNERFLEFLYHYAGGKKTKKAANRMSFRKRIKKAFQLKKLQMDS